jgi:hypothetical protein
MKKQTPKKRRGRPATRLKPAIELTHGGQPATWHDEGSWCLAFVQINLLKCEPALKRFSPKKVTYFDFMAQNCRRIRGGKAAEFLAL